MGRFRLRAPLRLPLTGAVSVAGDVATSGAPALPAWVDNLPLWEWYQIPNTDLASVDPVPKPRGYTRAKIDVWCGATLKRSGSVYLLGPNGGHGDYAGNEVDALALNVEAPQWVELRAPTAEEHIITGAAYYLDSRPAAQHSYTVTQFLEDQNRLVQLGRQGLNWDVYDGPPDGWYTGIQWIKSFNLDTGDWDPPEYFGQMPLDDTSMTLGPNFNARDPSTGYIYQSSDKNGWRRLDPSTRTWTKLSSVNSGTYNSGAIDPVRQQVLIVGGWSNAAPVMRDLATGANLGVTFTGLGAAALTYGNNDYPGVFFDEGIDKFVVVRNTYNATSTDPILVWTVDPVTYEVAVPTMTGTPPTRRTNGIHNSCQYAPELKGWVMATDHTKDVYFVRTAV